MKLKLRAFTLVELMVVITIITVLSTYVAINLTSARKRSRDDRRISDIQLIANALDQYATSHARIYPLPGVASIDDTGYVKTVVAGIIADKLKDYINPVPSDPTGGDDYKYYYIYRKDGRNAAVVASKFETGDTLCNIHNGDLSLPEAIKQKGFGSCYFVSR